MKTKTTSAFSAPVRRAGLGLVLLGLAGAGLLGACSKDKDESTPAPAGAGDGTVTWTHNGTVHTSTLTASAVQDSDTSLLITGGSADLKTTVSLRLVRIYKTGPGVYELRKGSVLNNYSIGALTLGGSTGTVFSTLYGPTSPSNGAVTVSQYDRAGQRVAGTFFFTAGALPNTAAVGTPNVTNGSFSFTRFR